MRTLPLWLQYLQAIAVVCIPPIGAWIAWQQMRIADVKLQHDLYDRRFAVYGAARKLLLEIATTRTASVALSAYAVATADAIFLLNDEIATYLDDLRKRAERLQARTDAMEAMPVGDRKTAMFEQTSSEFLALNRELAELVERFKPFLTLDRRKQWCRVRARK
jgi:hypothetical protein